MHIKRVFVATIPILLLGCAVAIEPKQFLGPNSKTAYSMKCSGNGRTLEGCYQKAGELCPGGYNIVDRTNGTVGIPMQSGTLMVPQYGIAIECK